MLKSKSAKSGLDSPRDSPRGKTKVLNNNIRQKLDKLIAKGESFFSFEYFPPRTELGAANLFNMFDRMGSLNPLFIDITWSAGGNAKQEMTLDLVRQTQELCCLTVNMHLTCNNSTREELIGILDWCKERGITNILALRGDPPRDPDWREEDQEFHYAIDLVKLIREVYGDYFCVSVAGYPYGHPDCPTVEQDIQHLKEKVDAGADFVVSQLFFSAEDYLSWYHKCIDVGITVPILPGILPIQGYSSLRNITKMCSVPVPESIIQDITPIKDDDAAILEYGVKFAVEMCKKLLAGGVPGLHFYTLNRELATSRILEELQMVNISRELPWTKAVVGTRGRKEDVRPIYWANRTKSYLSRTQEWQEFPNGRWGDNRSPAFGELTHHHIFLHQKRDKPETLRALWGEKLTDKADISRVFVEFLRGNINKLPWINSSIALETGHILNTLTDINNKGYWTINSQPSVNGAKSTEPDVGWGPKGGYVYQKAYLEFFASSADLEKIVDRMNPNQTRYHYQAVNMEGDYQANFDSAIAVTWGVFPGTQIIQPTVVDPVSFMAWKDEAFGLWMTWRNIYEEDVTSKDLIDEIYHNYYLVTIVDNEFVSNEFFSFFQEL